MRYLIKRGRQLIKQYPVTSVEKSVGVLILWISYDTLVYSVLAYKAMLPDARTTKLEEKLKKELKKALGKALKVGQFYFVKPFDSFYISFILQNQNFHLGLGHLSFFYHCEKRNQLVESLQGRQKDLDIYLGYPTTTCFRTAFPSLGIRSS